MLRCAALKRLLLPRAAGEYTAQFEALLLEEAREAVRGGWAEAAQAGHLFDATVIGCAVVCCRTPGFAPPQCHAVRGQTRCIDT